MRTNMEKLRAIADIYDELMHQQLRTKKEMEEAKLKYEYLREQTLRLSLDTKKIVEHVKGVPNAESEGKRKQDSGPASGS